MVRVNKYETSIFGAGPLGNAIFMVNYHIPGVPAELWDDFIKAVGHSRWWGNLKRRYPYRINQLESAAQKAVWAIFRDACNCFSKQPHSGGAVPPDVGPRNRSWWYDNDPGVPPIYFNYFMQQTLNWLYAGLTPVWCRLPTTCDAYVFSEFPDTNYGAQVKMYSGIFKAGFLPSKYRSFIKIPAGNHKTIYLYMDDVTVAGTPQRQLEVRDVLPTDWEEDTITWNEFTPLGDVIGYFDPPFVQGTWLEIFVGSEASVCIKLVDETSPPDGTAFWIGFSTREESDPFFRPYFLDES